MRFVTALDLTKYLQQIKQQIFLLTCAPISELPSNTLMGWLVVNVGLGYIDLLQQILHFSSHFTLNHSTFMVSVAVSL